MQNYPLSQNRSVTSTSKIDHCQERYQPSYSFVRQPNYKTHLPLCENMSSRNCNVTSKMEKVPSGFRSEKSRIHNRPWKTCFNIIKYIPVQKGTQSSIQGGKRLRIGMKFAFFSINCFFALPLKRIKIVITCIYM